MNLQDHKTLIFLINFFEWVGLFNYPFYIFRDTKLVQKDVLEKWKEYNNTDGPTQLYVHTLFCETKCHFCNCVSYVENNESYIEKYKNYLKSEIDTYSQIITKPLDSLYFGGGTVTYWSEEDLEEIFSYVRKKFRIKENATWMVELHPESTNRKKLEVLKKYGVTNVMLWLQSLNKELSLKNNRPYSWEKIRESIDHIVELWFKSLYFDMMYALPFENIEDVYSNMDALVEIGTSLYWKIELNIEINKWNISNNVPFYQLKVQKDHASFLDFVKAFLPEVQEKTSIINDYIDKHLDHIFSKSRDEIDSRNRYNTAILWIGYAAISYIPRDCLYWLPVDYKNVRDFYSTQTSYQSVTLKQEDDGYHFLLNNLRGWVPLDVFKDFLRKNPQASSVLQTYKDKFHYTWNKIILESNTDIETHLLSLCLYGEDIKREVYKNLLWEWIKLWNSGEDLYKNIDMYLEMYYTRPHSY